MSFQPKISRNAAVCGNCRDEVESKEPGVLVKCSCGAIAVDGGRERLQRYRKAGAWYEDTSVILGPGDVPLPRITGEPVTKEPAD